MAWIVGCDVGGTFTDFFIYEEGSGEFFVHKTPSTPDNPARAIVEGLKAACAARGLDPRDISRLEHGTTVATNCLIQRRGGKVALITTKGFRDLLEIGRQIRPRMFDLQVDQPEALVPREWRLEVDERVHADGSVERALGADDLAVAIAAAKAAGVEAVAVCFLFGFLNPAHEKQVGEALRKAAPGLYVSLSCEVQPEFREYERLSTTVLNAYLQPVMVEYLSTLEREIGRDFPKAAIGINQSSGGLMSIDRARRFPVRTALSGPAAGAVGAIHTAKLADRPNVITFDMGGTSTDVALLRDYKAGTSFDRTVADFPVRLPMIDIATIGAGGGSIAWFERDGLMKVGPISAGAVPGPACYGIGGDRPTVTDANLVLGRLSARGLIGGRMPLDAAKARAALVPIAERLGFTVERAAHGVLGIVVSNMVRAIRSVSVERGHDPRGFTLMPFGGAGALHAIDVARSLGIREILVPPAPGILCAQGLVVSDLKEDFVRTLRRVMDEPGRGALARELADLMAAATRWCDGEGISAANRRFAATLDMRYVGQNFELPVALGEIEGGGAPAVPDLATLRRSFFAVHEQNYGYFNPDDAVEVVNLRLAARGLIKPTARPWQEGRAQGAPPASGTREVWFTPDKATPTPVYERDRMRAGHALVGPAVIEQLDATSLLYPGDRLTVDANFNLLIETVS
ncbi:MAG: hydantoinase/oxoprolinase family protein [Alphaproteobacteria bacterium]|nr:hydantoinase/oxoprolinase family protein [Alphaproteobacteria bacterium]